MLACQIDSWPEATTFTMMQTIGISGGSLVILMKRPQAHIGRVTLSPARNRRIASSNFILPVPLGQLRGRAT